MSSGTRKEINHKSVLVTWNGEVSREVKVERGVRQGCIISPLLFNLYSEFMIKEAMENMEGIKFIEIDI